MLSFTPVPPRAQVAYYPPELLPHASTNYTCVTLLPSRFPACGLLAGAMQESLVRCAAPSWEKKFSPAPDPETPMEPATLDAAPLLPVQVG